MQLFYAAEFTAPEYILSEEESRHAVKVLRLVEGDTLHITDGRGSLYRCEVASAHPKHCLVRVVELFAEFEKLPSNLTMAVAPTKISTATSGSWRRQPRLALHDSCL